MKEFILIVDDDSDIRRLLGIYLGNEGYRYLACESAAEAMDALEHYQVDLILLDVMMPGIDGVSACLKIREKTKCPSSSCPRKPRIWTSYRGSWPAAMTM